jgi:hypothetical protein
MPVFAIVVLLLALVVVVGLIVRRSRALKSPPNPRRKLVKDDSPRMPTGDMPPRESSHRRH